MRFAIDASPWCSEDESRASGSSIPSGLHTGRVKQNWDLEDIASESGTSEHDVDGVDADNFSAALKDNLLDEKFNSYDDGVSTWMGCRHTLLGVEESCPLPKKPTKSDM